MIYHENHKGYTLVEVMIAIVISFVLILAATATYIAQNRSYVTQENVAEINTQAKIAHDMIADSIRSAGFGIPADLNANPINTFANIITPVDGGAANVDKITIVGGFRRIGTLWPDGGGPGMAPPAVVPMGAITVRIFYDGNQRVDTNNASAISIDGIQFASVLGVAPCCDGNADIVTLASALPQDFPLLDTDNDNSLDTGRPIYLVEDVIYCVDILSPTLDLHRIRRNAFDNPLIPGCPAVVSLDDDIIARNIQDLQFAYAVDANGDGLIDIALGLPNILDGPDFMDGTIANIPDPSIIRAVRINVLARANTPDPDFAGLGAPPPLIENRAFAATPDNFRRRWWQTLVTMRNEE